MILSGGVYNPELVIGDGVIIQYFFTCLIADRCEIGANTIIAHNVSIITENHGNNIESKAPLHAQMLKTDTCKIGKNCWIGCNTVLLPGAAIGDNCIVAANSVVNKKFHDNCLIGGTPARILKTYDFNSHKWVKYYENSDDIQEDKRYLLHEEKI